MAWWNPLTWFAGYDPKTATAAQVLDRVDVIEDGKPESVEALRDAVEAGDKYLFEVISLEKSGEVLHIVPLGETSSPLGLSDRKPPFEAVKALLTLEEAARLKELSKSAGGDGLARTAEQVAAETVIEAPAPVAVPFGAEALARARPDQVLKAVKEIEP